VHCFKLGGCGEDLSEKQRIWTETWVMGRHWPWEELGDKHSKQRSSEGKFGIIMGGTVGLDFSNTSRVSHGFVWVLEFGLSGRAATGISGSKSHPIMPKTAHHTERSNPKCPWCQGWKTPILIHKSGSPSEGGWSWFSGGNPLGDLRQGSVLMRFPFQKKLDASRKHTVASQ
jgi:hypothetical protein